MFNLDPIYLIDFYKAGHYAQYPENTTEIYSNFTPRSSRTKHKEIIWFGLQPVIINMHKMWTEKFFSQDINVICEKYKKYMDITLGKDSISIDHIKKLHKIGYLPLEIKALKEGVKVPMGIPVFTIKNTHPDGYWLVNYLESWLSCQLWRASTSATTAFAYRSKFEEFNKRTGLNKDFIKWAGHDFSFRGMGGDNDSIMSAMAHLLSFLGSDSVSAAFAIEEMYGTSWENELITGSVPATEHSVMCAGTKDGEFNTFKRLITELYPTGIVSIVSDSWDYFNVLTDYLPKLKNDIMNRDGRVVIRPDSGDPVDIICGIDYVDYTNDKYVMSLSDAKDAEMERIVDILRDETDHGCQGDDVISSIFKYEEKFYNLAVEIYWNRYDKQYYFIDDYSIKAFYECELKPEEKGSFQILWEIFGGTYNDKGYKVLDTHIGLLYGDSITEERQEQILTKLESKGFSADNLVLGIGSFSYVYNTRDTYGFAMKATNVKRIVDGVEVSYPIFKDPVTNTGTFTKKSAKGYLKVINVDGKLTLVDQISEEESYADDNEMKVVYKNGEFYNKLTFTEIRNTVESQL